jgi:glycerol-3-phosphate dehydrogenase
MHDKEYNENWVEPIAGSHITLKRFLPLSVLLQANDGRIFFVINRGDQARVGTTEWDCPDPDQVKPRKEDIDYLLQSLSKYFPAKKFSLGDILSSDAAVRPLAKPAFDQRVNEISREHDIRVDHAGVIHVLGVKLTDHRRAAQEIVDELVPQLLRINPGIKTRTQTDRVKL